MACTSKNLITLQFNLSMNLASPAMLPLQSEISLGSLLFTESIFLSIPFCTFTYFALCLIPENLGFSKHGCQKHELYVSFRDLGWQACFFLLHYHDKYCIIDYNIVPTSSH